MKNPSPVHGRGWCVAPGEGSKNKDVIKIIVCEPLVSFRKTPPIQLGDNQLTKTQLVAELERLNGIQHDIDSKKGMTGTNVASFLFWWPGLAYTYYDAGEATRLVEQRRAHLTALYNQQIEQEKPKSGRSSA